MFSAYCFLKGMSLYSLYRLINHICPIASNLTNACSQLYTSTVSFVSTPCYHSREHERYYYMIMSSNAQFLYRIWVIEIWEYKIVYISHQKEVSAYVFYLFCVAVLYKFTFAVYEIEILSYFKFLHNKQETSSAFVSLSEPTTDFFLSK